MIKVLLKIISFKNQTYNLENFKCGGMNNVKKD